jgi:phosphoribosylformylglycinamidine synthase
VILFAGAPPSSAGFAGSEFKRITRGVVAGRPSIDLEAEKALQRFLIESAGAGLVRSAHDVGVGGLAVALAECCVAGGVGAELMHAPGSAEAFGETQSRAIVSCDRRDVAAMREMAKRCGVSCDERGSVGGTRLRLGPIDVSIDALSEAYESGLPRALEGVAANV